MRIKPKKRLGQNFLRDPNTRRKIVAALRLNEQDTLVEIGPGAGELTALMAPRVRRLIAVELDAALVPLVREACSSVRRADGRRADVRVVHGDFLSFDLKQAGSGKLKVVGNIPYYISTPIIEKLIEEREHVTDAWLTVQREFAERIIARPGTKDFGSLTCFVAYYADASVLFRIPPGCFFPAPKVDSAFLQLRFGKRPLLEPDAQQRMFTIIRAAFNQRRKTLRRSLHGIVNPDQLAVFLTDRGFTPDARPEQLGLDDFAALTVALTVR